MTAARHELWNMPRPMIQRHRVCKHLAKTQNTKASAASHRTVIMEELREVEVRVDCEATHSMNQKANSLACDVGSDHENVEKEETASDDHHQLRLGVGGIDGVCPQASVRHHHQCQRYLQHSSSFVSS